MFVSNFFSISSCSLFWLSIGYNLLFLNNISWSSVLWIFRHLINYIVSIFQFTSGLCLTNQLYPKNISILFKSVITALVCFLYLLILTSISIYYVTSLFLILSVLKTLNDLFMDSILILSSFISYLSIPVWVYPEFTSIKIKEGGLDFFSFLFFFYFIFYFISLFSIFKTTGVRVDWSRYYIKSPDGKVTKQIMRLGRI